MNTLRGKLLALFVVLAVGPLIGIGVFGYLQPRRALEDMLARQAREVAAAVVDAIDVELAARRSGATLLADNAESQALLLAAMGEDPVALAVARAQADTFFTAAFARFGVAYRSAALSDAEGRLLVRAGFPEAPTSGRDWFTTTQSAGHGADAVRGSLVLVSPIAALIPPALATRTVGAAGRWMVIDVDSGRVIGHSARTTTGDSHAQDSVWTSAALARLAPDVSRFRFRDRDSVHVAAAASVQGAPWTVVATAAVDEFAAPFVRAGIQQFFVVMSVVGITLLIFVHFLRRTTASLETLTVAAEEVSRGRLSPSLEVGSNDEIGRLGHSFAVMTVRLREMMSEIESSRQMAVLGEFAARIAHEIRNPLTGIKLNLQGLGRDAQAGLLSPHSRKSVDLTLREISRLDGVVSGILDLARVVPGNAERISPDDVLTGVIAVAAPQALAAGVTIHAIRSSASQVSGDAAQLSGALLNLVLNGIAAAGAGGSVVIETSDQIGPDETAVVRIAVRDSGPGIPDPQRQDVFRPFFTTRQYGTGLGLPIARRSVEGMGGRLSLSEARVGEGAELVITLPACGRPGDGVASSRTTS